MRSEQREYDSGADRLRHEELLKRIEARYQQLDLKLSELEARLPTANPRPEEEEAFRPGKPR